MLSLCAAGTSPAALVGRIIVQPVSYLLLGGWSAQLSGEPSQIGCGHVSSCLPITRPDIGSCCALTRRAAFSSTILKLLLNTLRHLWRRILCFWSISEELIRRRHAVGRSAYVVDGSRGGNHTRRRSSRSCGESRRPSTEARWRNQVGSTDGATRGTSCWGASGLGRLRARFATVLRPI